MKNLSIVTKGGDKGETSLYTGERVPKDHVRMHAIGEIDELNAALALAHEQPECPAWLKEELTKVQNELFRLGGDLATPLAVQSKQERMSTKQIEILEMWIKNLEEKLPAQHAFLLPNGTALAAHLHLARAICRRAERSLVTLTRSERINPECQVFVNRLSDYLFLAARQIVRESGKEEVAVQY